MGLYDGLMEWVNNEYDDGPLGFQNFKFHGRTMKPNLPSKLPLKRRIFLLSWYMNSGVLNDDINLPLADHEIKSKMNDGSES